MTIKAITQNKVVITLDDVQEIHRGGEGRILMIPELPNQVAKIYHAHISPITAAQVQALQVLQKQFFVTPNTLIFEKGGLLTAFVSKTVLGFTMNYLDKAFQPLATLFSKPYCKRKNIDFKTKLGVLQSLQMAIQQAHQEGIVIGDLSGLNVLVNDKGVVKLIDTDAYATKAHPHSGLLLNDIRDHYYGGQVSKESDYFSFAVLAFQMLTHLHPFKGIHPQFKTLADRMIQALPVFATNTNITIPKCYEAITDLNLQRQFEAIFSQKQRFMIDLAGVKGQGVGAIQPKPIKRIKVKTGRLQVKAIYTPQQGEWIEQVSTSSYQLLIQTNQRFLIYGVAEKGISQLKIQFQRKGWNNIWVGNQQAIGLKNKQLWQLNLSQNLNRQALQNAHFSGRERTVQLDNYLLVIGEHQLRTIQIDQINSDFIQLSQQEVFGKGLHHAEQGLWQQVGGKIFLFFKSGEHLSTIPMSVFPRNIQVFGRHGLVSYLKKKTGTKEVNQVHHFFSINGMQVHIAPVQLDMAKKMTYKPLNRQHGLIFEPQDDALVIRRTQDFQIVQEMPHPLFTNESQLYHTQAGIIVLEDNQVYLVNS